MDSRIGYALLLGETMTNSEPGIGYKYVDTGIQTAVDGKRHRQVDIQPIVVLKIAFYTLKLDKILFLVIL